METTIMDLPIEILIMIISYLSVEDISPLLAVCKSWRNALNVNIIWKKLCKARFSTDNLFPRLMNRAQVAKPCLPVPVNVTEDLSDVCEWRLRFMELSRLSRNWQQGYYNASQQTLSFTDSSVLIKDYDDEYEFRVLTFPRGQCVMNTERYIISVFNVTTNPCSYENFPLILGEPPEFKKICKCKLIVRQKALIQIYSLSSNSNIFHLMKAFALLSLEEGLRTPSSEDINEWYQREIIKDYDITKNKLSFDHDGNYFVAIDEIKCMFSLWDMHLNNKITQNLFPEIKDQNKYKIYLHFDNMYIESYRPANLLFKMYCFSFTSMSYTNFQINYTDIAAAYNLYKSPLFCENFVIRIGVLNGNPAPLLWDRGTGTFLYSVSCNLYLADLKMIPFTPFLFMGGPWWNGYQIFDTEKRKTVFEISSNDIIALDILPLSKHLALVTLYDGSVCVWDLITGTKLYDTGFEFCQWMNASGTKALVYNNFESAHIDELTVIDFW